MNFGLPIRLKIVLLIAGALVTSLMSYLYVGNSLIVKDKVSYIYDYNLSEVRASSEQLEARIKRFQTMAYLMSGILTRKNADMKGLANILEENSKSSGLSSLLIASKGKSGFKPIRGLGKKRDLKTKIKEANWTPKYLASHDIALHPFSGSELLVGVRVITQKLQLMYFFGILETGTSQVADSRQASSFLYNSKDKKVFLESENLKDFKAEALAGLMKMVGESKFPSGVNDWNHNDVSYITGYNKLSIQDLIMVRMIPRDVAFEATRSLVQRSVILGIAILLLAVGFTLLFVRQLTNGIRQMWEATKQVAQGDFTFRVDSKVTKTNDEIGSLGKSFNTMAEKIDELMEQTAIKARMEKELETAQMVQNLFFPEKGYTGPQCNISGKSIPATECGGDWWNYAWVGDHLIMAIGDVTGHGVSAALVTAAAHGTFTVVKKRFQRKPTEEPDIRVLIDELNGSVLAAAAGSATMTFVACVLNSKTGELKVINASHRPPYVYRPNPEAKKVMEQFKPLMVEPISALGHKEDLAASEILSYQLAPGDILFLYTDGLVECENPDGKRMSTAMLVRKLAEIYKRNASNAEQICVDLINESMDFYGEETRANLPDDITVVVATVPDSATFTQKPKAAA